ncbi:MAG: ATPase [Spirochaetaceae bacterium]|nr:ATPase [Spirochaetaceae bacterium]|tara:strand:+ start:39037 stop:39525 length:489 start_codon:yes stop_codon:yes gene_type:complete
MESNSVKASIQGSQVIYERYFDAPVELVFEAWSQEDQLSQWWGPDGFTLTTVSMDFQDGGLWDFIMHGPDGTNYKNKIKFLEILNSKRIVYRHLGDGEENEDVDFSTTVTFESEGEGTRLKMYQDFGTEEELRRVDEAHGAIEGGKQHIENLQKYLNLKKSV